MGMARRQHPRSPPRSGRRSRPRARRDDGSRLRAHRPRDQGAAPMAAPHRRWRNPPLASSRHQPGPHARRLLRLSRVPRRPHHLARHPRSRTGPAVAPHPQRRADPRVGHSRLAAHGVVAVHRLRPHLAGPGLLARPVRQRLPALRGTAGTARRPRDLGGRPARAVRRTRPRRRGELGAGPHNDPRAQQPSTPVDLSQQRGPPVVGLARGPDERLPVPALPAARTVVTPGAGSPRCHRRPMRRCDRQRPRG